MDTVIVDTNVIVIANYTDDNDLGDCPEHCQNRLEQILSRPEKVVIDDSWRILGEYNRHTDPNTRQGIGDMFVKMHLRNQKNSKGWVEARNLTS